MRHLRNLIFASLIAGAVFSSGCQTFRGHSAHSYKTLFDSNYRDFEKAKSMHDVAVDRLCDGAVAEAEQILRDALVCDSSYGPAHNTLGKIYFDQRKFYLAAWEFEHASSLMPERSEPQNNLGLVYEAVGDFDQAIAYFHTAWAKEEDNAQFLGNLLRARIRNGERVSDLEVLFRRLIEIDDRKEWSDWANEQLVLRNEKSRDSTIEEPRLRQLLPLESLNNESAEPIEGIVEDPAQNF